MDAILKRIIATSLVPALKELSYRKNGLTFIRKVNDVCHVLNVQKSTWNQDDCSSFTINIGVYSPTFARARFPYLKPETVHETTCALRFRIGSFAIPPRDVWWDFRLVSGARHISAISSEIEGLLTGKVLPWLDRFQSDDKVLEFERAPQPIA
jgi:hypothetical protein